MRDAIHQTGLGSSHEHRFAQRVAIALALGGLAAAVASPSRAVAATRPHYSLTLVVASSAPITPQSRVLLSVGAYVNLGTTSAGRIVVRTTSPLLQPICTVNLRGAGRSCTTRFAQVGQWTVQALFEQEVRRRWLTRASRNAVLVVVPAKVATPQSTTTILEPGAAYQEIAAGQYSFDASVLVSVDQSTSLSAVSSPGAGIVVVQDASGVTWCQVALPSAPLATTLSCSGGPLSAPPVNPVIAHYSGTSSGFDDGHGVLYAPSQSAALDLAVAGLPPPAPTASISASTTIVASSGATVVLSFSATNAAQCQLSSVPSLWSAGSTTVNCAGQYSVDVLPSSGGGQWTFTLMATGAGGATTATVSVAQESSLGAASSVSPNWSGYVVPSSSAVITDAEGTFKVPNVNCATQSDGEAALWVGTGGVSWSSGGNSGSLLQTGVEVKCSGGVQVNVGWWELWPVNNEQDFTSFPVAPGDTIHAAVYQSATGTWSTELEDLTTGLTGWMVAGGSWGVGPTSGTTFSVQGSSAQISYAGGYSAEWVAEDPTDVSTNAYFPFINYGSVTFTDLLTSLSPWSLDSTDTWALVQSGVTLSTPLSVGADDFTVAYTGP